MVILVYEFSSSIENVSIILLISHLDLEFEIFYNLRILLIYKLILKKLLKPSSITLFLSKFFLNGFEISILLISKDFALTFSVEKNIVKLEYKKKYINVYNNTYKI